jgi:hypothetical protein
VVTLDGGEGYPGGPFVRYNGSAWATSSGDMPFRLYENALIETSQQIKSLLTNYGQFFSRILVEVASGIDTESYRNGDSDAQFEIEQLCETGTDNNRRILIKVESDRSIRVYEEPSTSTLEHFLARDGRFYQMALPVRNSTCPVGVWSAFRDILPQVVNLSQLSGIEAFFVERSEYDAESGLLRFEPYGMDVWDMGMKHG